MKPLFSEIFYHNVYISKEKILFNICVDKRNIELYLDTSLQITALCRVWHPRISGGITERVKVSHPWEYAGNNNIDDDYG